LEREENVLDLLAVDRPVRLKSLPPNLYRMEGISEDISLKEWLAGI
jgi:hypothetical protein